MRLLLWLPLGLMAFVQPEWTWSSHPAAGFKILSPYPLTERITKVPTETDVIEYHQFSGGSVNDSVLSMAFIVDYYQLPDIEESEDDDYLRSFFENTIDPMLSAVKGSLVYMDINRHADQDVCEWKATYRNGEGIIRGHSVLTKENYYGLQVFGLSKDKPEDQMNKFFNSFKLL